MPHHQAYVLHIWHSRALGGRQWVARLDDLPDGQQVRFANRDALLRHLETVIFAEEHHDISHEALPKGGDAGEDE